MTKRKDRGAVLQFEIDRERWRGIEDGDFACKYTGERPMERLRYMARTAVNDVIRNGGTFVLVATADKITMVQRPDAETFEPADKPTTADTA